jgi:putative phosphoesterase
MLTKIGVIGDIHAESTRLRKALDFLQAMDLDEILCVGDVVDGSGDVNECCDLLREHQVIIVKGNHDEWFLKNTMRDLPVATPMHAVNEVSRNFLQDLPLELEFQTPAGSLLLCHGLGKHTMAKVRDDDFGYALESNFELQELIQSRRYQFVLNGHTHCRMMRNFDGVTVINAGSLLYEDAGFQTIDFSTKTLKYFSLGNLVPGLKRELKIYV